MREVDLRSCRMRGPKRGWRGRKTQTVPVERGPVSGTGKQRYINGGTLEQDRGPKYLVHLFVTVESLELEVVPDEGLQVKISG